MTTLWKQPKTSPRRLENAWVNNIYSSHDLWCDCDDPQLHFLAIINKNSNAPKPESEIKNIKCLLTGRTGETTGEKDDIGLEDGELEKLFAEDTEEDSG